MNMTDFMTWTHETAEGIDRNKYRVITRDKYTIVINERNGKVGIARLHPDDERIRDYGIALAYCRCKGTEFPKITTYKKLSEMKNGDVFFWRNCKYRYIGKNGPHHVVYFMRDNVYLTWSDSKVEHEMSD